MEKVPLIFFGIKVGWGDSCWRCWDFVGSFKLYF